jgi:hypothetical protein
VFTEPLPRNALSKSTTTTITRPPARPYPYFCKQVPMIYFLKDAEN